MPFSITQKELPLVAFLALENWHFFVPGFSLQSFTQSVLLITFISIPSTTSRPFPTIQKITIFTTQTNN
ncbi:MAG: hypothetical protein CVU07_11335 [Bacteroidetes bacterium HGW-Bacteroidetes-23]|nr:MAG: hypothetical protein CVU07_11335 [Bacteroidetes bacterium HGW-Bacteroidetes-23]